MYILELALKFYEKENQKEQILIYTSRHKMFLHITNWNSLYFFFVKKPLIKLFQEI